MRSLQSNTLLSTTKCSNLSSVSLVSNRNLDTALAFKNCRPEFREGLRNETISKKGGHRYFIKKRRTRIFHKKWGESPWKTDHNRNDTQSKHINEVFGFPQQLCHQRDAQVRSHFPPPTAETGAGCFWTQDMLCMQGMGGGG